MLFYQVDYLCKLKTKEVQALIPILVELQNLFFSTQKSDYLKQQFTYDFQGNFSVVNKLY